MMYLVQPINENGQANNTMVTIFLAVGFIAIMLLAGFILSLIKTFTPDRKLPHLLIKESLIHGSIAGLTIIGLLTLQLLRAFTLINAGLWLAIIVALGWIIEASRRSYSDKPSTQPSKFLAKRVTKLQK